MLKENWGNIRLSGLQSTSQQCRWRIWSREDKMDNIYSINCKIQTIVTVQCDFFVKKLQLRRQKNSPPHIWNHSSGDPVPKQGCRFPAGTNGLSVWQDQQWRKHPKKTHARKIHWFFVVQGSHERGVGCREKTTIFSIPLRFFFGNQITMGIFDKCFSVFFKQFFSTMVLLLRYICFILSVMCKTAFFEQDNFLDPPHENRLPQGAGFNNHFFSPRSLSEAGIEQNERCSGLAHRTGAQNLLASGRGQVTTANWITCLDFFKNFQCIFTMY